MCERVDRAHKENRKPMWPFESDFSGVWQIIWHRHIAKIFGVKIPKSIALARKITFCLSCDNFETDLLNSSGLYGKHMANF